MGKEYDHQQAFADSTDVSDIHPVMALPVGGGGCDGEANAPALVGGDAIGICDGCLWTAGADKVGGVV